MKAAYLCPCHLALLFSKFITLLLLPPPPPVTRLVKVDITNNNSIIPITIGIIYKNNYIKYREQLV